MYDVVVTLFLDFLIAALHCILVRNNEDFVQNLNYVTFIYKIHTIGNFRAKTATLFQLKAITRTSSAVFTLPYTETYSLN